MPQFRHHVLNAENQLVTVINLRKIMNKFKTVLFLAALCAIVSCKDCVNCPGSNLDECEADCRAECTPEDSSFVVSSCYNECWRDDCLALVYVPDSGLKDLPDATVLDSSFRDAQVLDHGTLDMGTLDTGTHDAGILDAHDAGPTDSGHSVCVQDCVVWPEPCDPMSPPSEADYACCINWCNS